ncbi:PAS domain S-box [Bernardetia litoralis DSM 6794]|uniref:histidine kinase n=1 Tax=Bernardetia litoralis (strain ATCC 23117 / DSM 6794 / NBRC 15988 / NCIMB 1366 / Fx l1 / Sio-4) TaxID=880071 RepID=I4AQN5_BERLS|nr:PAS domain-containing protein [Bernardetia litoralis]AFM06270.1 PAS domain S-box [Bernardetia litoralis DSM 6794]
MRNSNTLKYALGGLFFGLLFPFFALILDGFLFKHLAFDWNMVVKLHKLNPIHFVIDSAPIVLAGTFAVMGYYLDKNINKEKNINYKQYSEKNRTILKRLRIGNIAVPIIIIILLIGSYFIMQSLLSNQQNDAVIINIAGKQRMLSQNISKNALYLTLTQGEERVDYINYLDEYRREFKTAHRNLSGKESTLDFTENHVNSTEIISLYDSINPYYNGLLAGVEEVLDANEVIDIESKRLSIRDAIQKVERNEHIFLSIMDKIVSAYEIEAKDKITAIEIAQISVTGFLIFISVIAFFVLKLTIDRVQTAFTDVEIATRTLEENNQELQASEEELRQNSEQMKTVNDNLINSQRELKVYINRVSQAKEMAKLAAYDLDIKTNEITHTEHLNTLLGLDKNVKIDHQFLEKIIHTDDYPILLESQKKSLKDRKDTYYRLRIKTDYFKDWHWFQGTTHGVFDKKGKLSYIVSSLQDITESVQKEQEIKKLLQEASIQNQELQASEEELRQNTEQLQLTNDSLFVAQREAEQQRILLNRAEEISQIGSFEGDLKAFSYNHSENLALIYGLDEEEMKNVQKQLKYYHKNDYKELETNSLMLMQGLKDNFTQIARFKGPKHTEWKYLKLEGTLIRDVTGSPERLLGVVQDITQITLQQKALEQSQKQLESLSNNLQGIMYRTLIDENRTTLFISKGVERITGYAASDFIDNKVRSFRSIIHQEDNFIDSEINQAIETKLPYKIEYRLIHKNGSIIWVEESGQVVEDEKQNVKYFDGVIIDITQRKQAETIIETQTQKLLISQKDLEQQQQMLSDAEKMAKMGSYIWDLVTGEIKHSENLPTIYGLEKGIVVDKVIFDSIIHPDEREAHQKVINEAITNGQREVFTTYRAKTPHLPKKPWKHYRTYSIINYNENGEPITFIGTAQDVSEEVAQQKTQEKLLTFVKENKENLEESQRLAQIVSYDMNLSTKKLEWSNSFEKVFQIENNQIPKNATEFHAWTEKEDLDEVNKSWTETLAKKEEFNAVYRINTPNKKTFYIREKSYPVFDEKGDIVHMKGTLQDITKVELARKKLEKTSEKLEKQNTNLISSINYAQRIQSAMLGGTQDLKNIFNDAFVFFEPKDVVSGDFYWYNEVGTRKIAIVGDCTGHGVPGAFMSLLGTTLLNEIILQRQVTTPSKILDFMQSEIRTILKQDTTGNRDGMDMAVVVVDTSTGMMEFAGAKNPLVYIHKKRKRGGVDTNLTIIKGDVHPIGGRTQKFIDAQYTNHIIKLENVEAFYIYSDGYQDQFGGEKGRKFMSTKFRQLLYDTHSTSMRHQRVSLKRGLMNWMGTEYDQIDDICVMGISI